MPPAQAVVRLMPRLMAYGAGLIVLTKLVPAFGMVVLAAAALHALRGPRQTAEALFVLAFAIMVNKTVAPVDISLVRWAVLAAAAGRTLWDTAVNDQPVSSAFGWLTALVATMAVFAVMASWLPPVSLFKALSFYMGTGTALVALYRTRHLAGYWQSCLLTLAVFVILGSGVVYLLGYGFERNGVSFQGILTHPQTYGPVVAVLTAYVTALVVFERRRSWVLLLTMIAGWGGIYLSQSRTAMLALVLAGGLVVVVGWFKRTWAPRIRRVMSSGPELLVGILALGTLAVAYGPQVAESGVDFLLKDEASVSVTGALEESRGGLMERSMDNFRSAPLTGIGLGVPSDLSQTRIEYGPYNIPIGAAVEKGFTPTAVLEEIGLVGAAVLVFLLATLMLPVFGRRGTIPLAWMLATTVLTTMGEAAIFAIGGNGLFIWLMFSLGYVCTVVDQRGIAKSRDAVLKGA